MDTPKLPFANDGSFMENFLKMQNQARPSEEPQTSAPVENPVEVPPATTSSANQDYVPGTRFQGPMDGYFFGTGTLGTGYYRDAQIRESKAEVGRPKSVMVKGNKTIVKSAKRPVESQPDPKKQKLDEKPRYLQEMERYKALSCGSDTKHDRPLVK